MSLKTASSSFDYTTSLTFLRPLRARRTLLRGRGEAGARPLSGLQQAHKARAEHDRHRQRQVRPGLRAAHQRRECTLSHALKPPDPHPTLAPPHFTLLSPSPSSRSLSLLLFTLLTLWLCTRWTCLKSRLFFYFLPEREEPDHEVQRLAAIRLDRLPAAVGRGGLRWHIGPSAAAR